MLTYSLVGQSRHFDVDSSSGQVYVVSVADLAGFKATLEVKVSDPRGLEAVTKVEVSVKNDSGLVFDNCVMCYQTKFKTFQFLSFYLRGKFYKNELCCLQVVVNGAANSNDVVVIAINQPANTVEEQITEVER